MKSSPPIRLLALVALAPLPWLAGCGGQPQATTTAPTAAVALPAALFAPIAGQPVAIATARQSAADGDRIVLRGLVGGRLDPFVEGRALMLLVDDSLPLCQGCCDTPWDMCCERPEKIAAHSATIQVVDPAGQPLRASLRGQGGLAPLARVTVAGTVRRQGEAIFLVDADHLSVHPAHSVGVAGETPCCPH